MAGARQRLLQAGESLFRRQGYSGTGLKALVAEADAPWGSLYHYFPEGKEQLGVAVMAYAGELYAEVWEQLFARSIDPAEAVLDAFRQEARLMERSDYVKGCPVGAVTLDVASSSAPMRGACAAAFAAWTAVIARRLVAAGVAPAKAEALADFVMAAMQGAIVMGRAAKSTLPILRTGETVRAVLTAEIAAAQVRTG